MSESQVRTCGHDAGPYGAPKCPHVSAATEDNEVEFVKYFVGEGLTFHQLCATCRERRDAGELVEVIQLCESCRDDFNCECVGSAGDAGIVDDPHPFDSTVLKTEIPGHLGPILDLAPVDALTPTWLVLADDGRIVRWECDTGSCTELARVKLPTPQTTGWSGHIPAPRLHAAPSGRHAAVVIDFGTTGDVFDLATGRIVLKLGGGDYHQETVPFSLAFLEHEGHDALIHRTGWNRLDVTDLDAGTSLAPRIFETVPRGQRPAHYLDYFHGELHVSPDGSRIADDGWVWAPIGAVQAWELDPWLSHNPFESEDGPSAVTVCGREYYWNHAMVWLDEHRLAVGGIGDDDDEIIPGARIFDFRLGTRDRYGRLEDAEVATFAGPGDRFFSDHGLLYAAADTGLEIWDPDTGARLGRVDGFHPTRHHRSTGELVEVVDGHLLRWKIADPR